MAFVTCLLLGTSLAAWALWTAISSPGDNGAAAATTVNQGATPTASSVGQAVTVSWAAGTLASGQPVAGYVIKRYDANTLAPQTILSNCTGTVAALTCTENAVPHGTWVYSVTPRIGAAWAGAESVKSSAVMVDAVPPVNTISLTSITGGAFRSGNTVYYLGAAAGSFRLSNALTDSFSGPASSTTSTLGGTTTGWTHTPSTVSAPVGGPYVSNPFTWTAGTTSAPTEAVTGRDVQNNAAVTTLSMVLDATGPTGSTISYADGYTTGRSVAVSFTTGTDAGSGVGPRQLQRSRATLTETGCGTFGTFTNLGPASPTSPYSDTSVSNRTCNSYRYVVTDSVGNQSVTTSPSVALVDYAYAVGATSGSLSYWRLGETSPTQPAADSKGNNPGTYVNSPTLNRVGAISADSNTAATFDGVDDYVTVARQIADDFSIEFWFSSTQGIGTGSQWWEAAGLVDAEVFAGVGDDFGVALRADGRVIAGDGAPDVSVLSASGYNDGAWHHVVFTRTRATGVLALYVDGAAAGTVTGNSRSLTGSAVINFGRSAAGGNYFAGGIDEVGVSSSVMSAGTVLDHYQLGTGPASDLTGPAGGSVTAQGLTGTGARYSTSTSMTLALATGTDAQGIASSGNTLSRATATLTSTGGANGVCGAFGAQSLIAIDPVSPRSDTVTDQACYRYHYVVYDTVGNATTYSSGDVKVDTTAPAAPTLAFSATTNAYWSGTGSTVYYQASGTGSFTTTAATADPASGIAAYAFPALGTGWSSTPGAVGVNTYSWTASPAAPGTKNVTATNNATVVSAGSPFTVTPDSSPPSAATISYADGYTAGRFVSMTLTTGTDAGSGIATRWLQRSRAVLTNGVCGTYDTFTNLGPASPTSPYSDTSVSNATCNRYRYVVTDNVGNQTIGTSASTAIVDYAGAVGATGGVLDYWRLGDTTSIPTADSFTDTAGTALTSHTNQAIWAHQAGPTTSIISTGGRVQRSSVTNGYSLDYVTTSPSRAAYTVSGDVVYVGTLANDELGVVARLNTSTGAYYAARYQSSNTWVIERWVGTTRTVLGTSGFAPLTVGNTYTIRLSVSGSSATRLNLVVNGVQTLLAIDTSSPLTAAGYAGLVTGTNGGTVVQTSTTGLHLDNFQVKVQTAVDSKGPNTGDFVHEPVLGVGGAISGDPNTAATFDGVNDFVQSVDPTGLPIGTSARSVEIWFKTTASTRQVLFNYGTAANAGEFGLWLKPDGGGMLAWGLGGGRDIDYGLAAPANDGLWHQAVLTYDGSGLTLYVDGASRGTAGVLRNTSVDAYGFSIGAITVPGDGNSGGYFNGSLDDVSVYSTAMTAGTVLDHYQLGTSPLSGLARLPGEAGTGGGTDLASGPGAAGQTDAASGSAAVGGSDTASGASAAGGTDPAAGPVGVGAFASPSPTPTVPARSPRYRPVPAAARRRRSGRHRARRRQATT